MKNILKKLKVIQTISNEERHKKGLKRLGRGYFNAHRLNPYNPLSYFTLIIFIVFGIIAFGIYGFWKETDLRNPFKWN